MPSLLHFLLIDCNLRHALTRLVVVWSICAGCAGAANSEDWGRPSLGFEAISLEKNAEMLKQFGKVPARNGLLVLSVSPGSDAAASGIRPMHVITHVNRKPVGSTEELAEILKGMEIGASVAIKGYGLTPANVWKPGSLKSVVMTERDNLMGYVTKETEQLNGTTFLSHVDAPEITEKSAAELYIAVAGDVPTLRMRLSHVAKDWVFGESVAFKCESDLITIPLTRRKDDIRRTGGISETWDFVVDEETLAKVRTIANERPSVVRFTGKQNRSEDREMGQAEWSQFRRMYRIYKMMVTK
jgi:hypothetical protein